MGRQDRFRSDREFLEGVLNDAEDMTLAMNNNGNAPYVIPVNYVLMGDSLYIHTALTGRKLDLLRQNPG